MTDPTTKSVALRLRSEPESEPESGLALLLEANSAFVRDFFDCLSVLFLLSMMSLEHFWSKCRF